MATITDNEYSFFSAIDERLRMQGIISFRSKNFTSEISSKYNLNILCQIFLDSEKFNLHYSLPLDLEKTSNFRLFLKNTNAVRKDGWYSIIHELDEPIYSDSLNALTSIPSVIIDIIQIQSGRTVITFRFHEKFMQEVSNFIIKMSGESESFNVDYIGKSHGLIHTILNSNSIFNLCEVDALFVPSQETMELNRIFGNSWQRAAKYYYGQGSVVYVYRTDSEIPDRKNENIKIISEEDHLFEYTLNEEYQRDLIHSMLERRIYSLAQKQVFNGKSVIVRRIMFEGFVNDFLESVRDSYSMHPEQVTYITSISRLKSAKTPG